VAAIRPESCAVERARSLLPLLQGLAREAEDKRHLPPEMVEAFTAAGPLDKVRARVAEVAERGDGVFLTPATYFIPPEQIGEYQSRIIEAFGPT